MERPAESRTPLCATVVFKTRNKKMRKLYVPTGTPSGIMTIFSVSYGVSNSQKNSWTQTKHLLFGLIFRHVNEAKITIYVLI